MTRREELAAQFMAGMLADPALDKTVPSWCVERAFTYADFFLAACEQKPEREPDAVWTLEECTTRTTNGQTWAESCRRLLAGRDRVWLKVFVEEVKP